MEFTDARCGACGTWRTVLVGYGGARVCLTCGAALDAGPAAAPLARLSASARMDALWSAAVPPGAEGRKERIRGWLEGQSVVLPEAYLAVLSLCERAAEVRFALPIVTLSTWRPVGERSFSDGAWTLRLQHPVRGHRLDFVLEGPGGARPLGVEIDPPAAGPPRIELRTALELRAAGYRVMRVPAERAEERGTHLRSAFMREALGALAEESAAAPAAPGPPRRLWSRHELVYDASGRPPEERRELVEDWLRSRGERLEGWQLDFLAGCERAGEVHFALPFLRLPGAEPADARTVHLDAWHTLTAQPVVEDRPVDFAFTASLPGPPRLVATLVEILPARGRRDAEEEQRRVRAWRDAGHAVLVLPAAEAGARGRRWADALLGERRRARDAG